MNWLSRFVFRNRMERHLEQELRFHLDQHAKDLMARGYSPQEAQRQVRLALGGPEQVKEACRDARGTRWLEDLARDTRYACRTLLRNPGLSLPSVLMLSLGLGAATAAFSVMDGILMRMLPVENPSALFRTVRVNASTEATAGPPCSLAMFERMKSQTASLADLMGYNLAERASITVGQGPQSRLYHQVVTGNYFDVLGVRPVVGRLIAPVDDEVPGRDPVAVISARLWRQTFGGSSSAVGSGLVLDGRRFNVIGVAPMAFFGVEVGKVVDVWTPVSMAPLDNLRNDHYFWLQPMGRLHPGTTIQQAAAPMQAVVDQVMREDVRQHAPPGTPRTVIDKFLSDMKIKGVAAGGGVAALRQQYGQALQIVMALVTVLLLIACTNVANIRLARETVREQEINLRLSLGAGPVRLVRQLLAETLVLTCISAVLGVLVSRLTVPIFVAMLEPSKAPAELSVPLDFRLLLFAALLALSTVLATGLVPALHLLRSDPYASLKSRTTLAGGRTGRIRKILVAAQIALSLVLVVGATLFSQTLTNLLSTPLGFSTADVLTARLTLPRVGDEQASFPKAWTQLLQRAGTLPGVVNVALSSVTLFDGEPPYMGLRTDAQQDTPHAPTAALVFVSAEYFKTLGIEVTRGAAFDQRSFQPNAPLVAMINESFASKFFGSQDPLSHRVSKIADSPNWHEIVGVVRDIRVANLRGTSPPIVFVPYTAMTAWTPPQTRPGIAMTLYVQGWQKVSTLSFELQHLTGAQFKLEGVSEQRRFIIDTLVRERLLQRIAAIFGTLSLILAALGLYAVMNYSILQRRQEIGVRIALGANPIWIVRSLMRDAGTVVFFGVLTGILIAGFATRGLRALLFGLTPTDPIAFITAASVLVVVALFAALIPSWRASVMNPMIALRHE